MVAVKVKATRCPIRVGNRRVGRRLRHVAGARGEVGRKRRMAAEGAGMHWRKGRVVVVSGPTGVVIARCSPEGGEVESREDGKGAGNEFESDVQAEANGVEAEEGTRPQTSAEASASPLPGPNDDDVVAAVGGDKEATKFNKVASRLLRKVVTRVNGKSQAQKLKELKLAADSSSSAEHEAKYAKLLLHTNNPGAVVSRFEEGNRPVNTNLIIAYLKALVRSERIDRYAEPREAGKGGETKSLGMLLKGLGEDSERALQGVAVTSAPPGSSVKAPLYVVQAEGKTPLLFQPVKLLLRLLGWLASALGFMLLYIVLSMLAEKYFIHVRTSSSLSSSSSSSPANGGVAGMQPDEFVKEAVPEKSLVRFSDVLGCDEAKEEMEDIVEFLRNPEKFRRLGGKLPKGVLLQGPPGTGKTLLARAVAGEADVPFFYRSGSEFEEMFVGVGARRVRALFAAAKKRAPCIIFVDEIDAIGANRKLWEGHTKKTLNQLLSEMDGFEQNDGVIVLAATNLAESLDPALTRSGRFDRHVTVSVPDIKGRTELLKHYLNGKPVSADVQPEKIARGTTGLSGAELANLVNEAALEAAKEDREVIDNRLIEFAKDKILMGSERKSMVVTERCRKITAYHEGGHALVAMNTVGASPVHKATIMPRGSALGLTIQLPSEDEHDISRQQLVARLDVLMGGRVAEEIIFGREHVTTGAIGDFRQATKLAKNMVTQWGMSEMGHVFVEGDGSGSSAETKRRVDLEVSRLVEDAYTRVTRLLLSHERELHRLASALMDKETLTAAEMYSAIGVGVATPPPPPHEIDTRPKAAEPGLLPLP